MIETRCLVLFIAIAGEIGVALVIRKNDKDVGFFGSQSRSSEEAKRSKKAKERFHKGFG